MKFKRNLLKNINSIAIGFGLIGFNAFIDVANAESVPKCIEPLRGIGAKVDGKYQKTAGEIGNEMDFCTETPERFVITIHELGLCTDTPIKAGPRRFSRDDCVVTMTSDGVTGDLAKEVVALPEMNGRPPSNDYTHAYIILTNTFGLRGSVTIKNGAGPEDYAKYCSMKIKDENGSNSTGPTTTGNFCTAEDHTEVLDNFNDEGYSAYFAPETLDGGGKVSALLTNSDTDLTIAANETEAKRLIGVFETDGSKVKITDDTKGLEMQLSVTDIGYGITFTNGEPTFFGSMPFKPIFTTF